MPTYTIDMSGQNDSWANAASALAKALTPNYEAQMQAKIAASQVAQNYAGADANYALARERNAGAALSERELATWGQLDTMFANEGMSPEERQDIFVTEFLPRLGKVDGGNVGDWALAVGGMQGLDDDRMSDLQTGAGLAYGSTIAGTREAERGVNSRFLMEQAGIGSREEAARNAELFPIYDPVKKAPAYAPRLDAIGAQPVLSETDAKGLALQGGTMPGLPAAGTGGFAFEGTSMDAQAGNFVIQANEKVRRGEQLTSQEQMTYDYAYTTLFGPKTELRQGVDGQLYPVQVQPPVPPGFMPPSGGAIPVRNPVPQVGAAPAAPAGAPTGAFPPPPGFPRPGLSFGLPAASLGQFSSAPRAPAPVGPGPAPMPGPGGVTVGAPVNTGIAPRKDPTEAAVRQITLGGAFGAGVRDLALLSGYDPATDTFLGGGEFPSYGTDAARWIEDNFAGGLGRRVAGDWNNRYRAVAFNTVEPILRLRTGAAAPITEQMAYEYGLLPQSGISDAENQWRIRKLFEHVRIYEQVAIELGMSPEDLFAASDEMIKNDPLLQEVRKRADAKIAALEAQGPATGTAADPQGRVPMVIELPGGVTATEVFD
jgi:hypothetical protein